ncbi:hypothetical protein [Campylobacter concisus]|uniref:hypothetical protein n=1 Tax=Campylobacter concisus TaxID=199 RepID=UPI0015E1B7A2|nr:hypothetical protein [Campylobacter concisus]
MKYAHYDKDTKRLLGYYDDEIHNDIPEPNIEISDEEWREGLNKNANSVDVKNQKLVRVEVEQEIDEKGRELAELEAQIKECEEYIRNALIIGNTAVLEDLRAEYKELLAQKQALEKGENKDEKEN